MIWLHEIIYILVYTGCNECVDLRLNRKCKLLLKRHLKVISKSNQTVLIKGSNIFRSYLAAEKCFLIALPCCLWSNRW